MSRSIWYVVLAVLLPVVLGGCAGEDRSDEMPRVPEGVVTSVTEQGDTCVLNGTVGVSHNSSLTECGFYWGNDTLAHHVEAAEAAYSFSALVDSTADGTYYAVAYATNGMGTTYGDTVHFTIRN